jgi:purine-binding chemotaxis protein CheW
MDIRSLQEDPALWRILQERAHALALHQVEALTEQGEEVLTFRLGNDGYSIPTDYIREVYPLLTWTALPTTPDFVVGLVNVRGKILAALDIRPLLHIAPAPPRSGAFLIIISAHGSEVGLLADEVLEVAPGDTELSPTLSAVAGHVVPWVQGLDSHMNLLLDPPLLLSDPAINVHDEMM